MNDQPADNFTKDRCVYVTTDCNRTSKKRRKLRTKHRMIVFLILFSFISSSNHDSNIKDSHLILVSIMYRIDPESEGFCRCTTNSAQSQAEIVCCGVAPDLYIEGTPRPAKRKLAVSSHRCSDSSIPLVVLLFLSILRDFIVLYWCW